MQTDDFSLKEHQVIDLLGIHDRNDLRALRRACLSEGVDWLRRSNAVCYSERAAQKLATHLEMSASQRATIAPGEKNGAEATDTSPEREKSISGPLQRAGGALAASISVVTVERTFPNGNRGVVQCRASDASLVLVRVRPDRSERFVRGMQLLASFRPAGAWEFAGNPNNIHRPPPAPRYPRAKGKW